jgi:hypothetical protein
MKKIAVCFLLCFTLLNSNQLSTHASTTPVIISEVNYAGSFDDSCKSVQFKNTRCAYDKWIELYNTTTVTQSLEGYKLQFRNSGATQDNLYLFGSIAPKSYFIISYTEVTFNSLLSQNGVGSDIQSAKLLRMSNLETGVVSVNLYNNFGTVASSIQQSASWSTVERRSLEYSNGGYLQSNNQWSGVNYATPGFSSFTLPSVEPIVVEVSAPIPKVAPVTQVIAPVVQPSLVREEVPVFAPSYTAQPAPVVFSQPVAQITTETSPIAEQSQNIVASDFMFKKQPVTAILTQPSKTILPSKKQEISRSISVNLSSIPLLPMVLSQVFYLSFVLLKQFTKKSLHTLYT